MTPDDMSYEQAREYILANYFDGDDDVGAVIGGDEETIAMVKAVEALTTLKKIQEKIEYPRKLYKGTVIEIVVYGKNSKELFSKVISNPLYFHYVDSCPPSETKIISPLTLDNISRNCLCVKLTEKVDGLGVAYKDDKTDCYRGICCYRDLISIIQEVVYEETPDIYSIKEMEEMLPNAELLQYIKDRMDNVCVKN